MTPTVKTCPAKVIEFHAALESGTVDKVNGIVRGVSLITGGIKARGHDLETDDKTLSQVHALATSMGKVPVKWNHKTGADAVNGYITDFSIDGNKVKGDWHLLKTHAQYEQALELAERMPGNIGLSAAFLGKEEKVAGVNKARCEELISVDLVAQPAANPDGLFSAGVDTGANGKLMETPATAATEQQPTLADLMEVIRAQGEALNQISDRFDDLEAAGAEDGLTPQQLKQIADMDDAELASLGITRDMVTAAVQEAADAGIDIDNLPPDGQDEGAYAARGDFAHANTPANATAESVTAELSDLRNRVIRFERKEKAEDEAAERSAVEQAFAVVEAKVVELAARNDALEHALENGSGSAVTANGEIVEFARKDGGRPANKAQTEFEARVTELRAGDKDLKLTAAILLAQKEDPARYTKHLEAKGVGLKHL